MNHTRLTIIRRPMEELAYEDRLLALSELKRLHLQHGIRFFNTPYDGAARAYSRNKLVARVVVTHVSERHVETWREGKKS